MRRRCVVMQKITANCHRAVGGEAKPGNICHFMVSGGLTGLVFGKSGFAGLRQQVHSRSPCSAAGRRPGQLCQRRLSVISTKLR